MLQHLRPAILMIALFTALTGILYPLAVTGVAQVAFPRQANGSLVELNGKVIGSSIMGQSFSGERYFHSRPSATVGPDPKDATKTVDSPYNAANSAGSNYGPTSKALNERMREAVEQRKSENGAQRVPTDLVTASGSGLDPHISPEAALFQVPRVAKARNLPEDRLRQFVGEHTEGRLLGILGEPRVNVLALNLALDGTPRR